MGQVYDGIDGALATWIAEQPMFFVATAPLAQDGHLNCSARGLDTFSVLGPRRVAWVDLTGSGVETIAHLHENGRVVVMFNAFGARPRVVRLHGTGHVRPPGHAVYDEVVARHPPHPSTRAVIEVEVGRVSDSCGYGTPVMQVVKDRELLALGAARRGPDGLAAYRAQHNARSLDGLPGLLP